MRTILADVNVLLATLVAAHPHHATVRSWWQEEVYPSGAKVALCRLTQLGVLRLLCNEPVMGAGRLDHERAWSVVQELCSKEQLIFAAEPVGLDQVLAGSCSGHRTSPGFWSDAYLASFAIASKYQFATLERGFKKVPGLDLLLLGD